MTRYSAIVAHDWISYWQTFVDGSAARLARFVELNAPPFLIENERELFAEWSVSLALAQAGEWYPTVDHVPSFYIPRAGCACSLCRKANDGNS